MPVNPEDLRSALRHWATGVTVVTSAQGSLQHGMTVNSFTSVSLTPPLILVSLEQSTRTHALVKSAGYFGVTILSASQRSISERFAGRDTEHLDRFEGLDTRVLLSGAPFIMGGAAFLDCQVVATYDAGTHTLFIAEVTALEVPAQVGGSSQPLVYYNRDYRGLQE
jgi:flavin reductase (DIM6/NTAB) family NADH-FMN oxidoreductase RutF